jgi:hypothetical protein
MKRLWVALFFQFAPQLTSFLIFTAIVRRYDVQDVASYVFTLNLFFLIMPALNPAFEQIVQVRLKGDTQTAGSVLSSSALIILLISVVFSIATLAYVHVSGGSLYASRIFWGFIPALIITPFTIIIQLFRARDDYSSLIRIASTSIFAGATVRIILALMKADVTLIALSFCIEPLVTSLYSNSEHTRLRARFPSLVHERIS